MRIRTIGFGIVLAFAASSCLLRPATRTVRPELKTPPWEERTVASKSSGQSYNYMYIAGPAGATAPDVTPLPDGTRADAPALLLLHGGFFDQRIWLNMDGLAENFQIYALEWPDESPFYTGNVTDYLDVLEDFTAAVGIDELFIGGVSNGVYGAIEFASRHPQKVKALFLFSSVMFGINDEEVEKRTAMAKRALRFKPDTLHRVIEWRIRKKAFVTAPGDIQLDDIFYTRPYSYYDEIFSVAVNQGAARQETQKVTCPVLVLHGSADETMPVYAAELTPTVFPDAEFSQFENQTHSFVFTYGRELVPVVFDFLQRRGFI